MKGILSKTQLLRSGFEEVGYWRATPDRLTPPEGLPAQRGVYAFVREDEVLYVGLASRSLRQRLSFYARPGSSQTTNIRLNTKIRELIDLGVKIRVLIAQPEDSEWNGFRISGSEGLEAAMIEDFLIPWNLKGTKTQILSNSALAASASGKRRARGTVPRAIIEFVKNNPRSTEVEIAQGVFGPEAVQQKVNPYCRKLTESGHLERLPTRPVTYIVRRVLPK